MPRAALNQMQIDDFRLRAIEVATALFGERGYEAVTMRAIAAAMDASPMTAYRYFENKAEIFALVRADAYRRFGDSQREAYELTDEPLERLLHLREAYLSFALAEPNSYRVMFELDQPDADANSTLAHETGRVFDCTCDAVAAAVEAGFIVGEPRTVAHLLWAQIHGLVTLHLAGKLTHGRTLEALRNAAAPVFNVPEEKR